MSLLHSCLRLYTIDFYNFSTVRSCADYLDYALSVVFVAILLKIVKKIANQVNCP